jgi:hypothetical protein
MEDVYVRNLWVAELYVRNLWVAELYVRNLWVAELQCPGNNSKGKQFAIGYNPH